ncbi:MAG: imidazolonepropionase [Rhodobacteraceae bacterium]|nr:imidazolonepropionase [Paracoccaceae bacterium]
MPKADRFVLKNAAIATMQTGGQPYGLIENGAIAVNGDRLDWVGVGADLPDEYHAWDSQDQGGRLVTPGLIDCHTHLVFGGNRATEFEMRLNGAGYEEIAKAGGGIISTVKATREASLDQLVHAALPRLDAFIAEGATIIEVKSGYGLNQETELNMLRAARKLAILRPVQIITSFLGAHATPAEYHGRDDAYIDEVCIPTLRAAHAQGLVDAVDGFCEGIAFSPAQIDRVFKVARDLDLPVKLHAEQLSHLGGTELATKYSALSADHLEYANERDASAMAKAGTVAVILPGAFYTLRETQMPPIEAFRKLNVPMAVATDANPGSSPLFSPLMAMNMACTLLRMTPEEALAGFTRNAALALGLRDAGMIASGMRADLAIWNVRQPAELAYRIGFNPLQKRIFGGAT